MLTFSTTISFSILVCFSGADLGSRSRFAMRCLSKPLAALSVRNNSLRWCANFSSNSSSARFRLGILSSKSVLLLNQCIIVGGVLVVLFP